MNRAKLVICRSGYTSMMELAELNKHHGLLIPTPGQPEQEYLSYYYEKMGWFYSKSQYQLNLKQDIPLAMKYKGFPPVPPTKDNAVRLYDELLAEYLD
jgi:UDP-N-acetylglucosamine:LPS N-acetylglucosamine transferase